VQSDSNGKIDSLIDQVGRLTESMMELKEASIAQNLSIQGMADQHDQTVVRFMGLVEALLKKDE
jgi:hypothetical protein